MNDNIKSMLDKAVAVKGKFVVLEQMTNMLHESYRIKASLELQGKDLGNLLEHIEMGLEAIDYLKSI